MNDGYLQYQIYDSVQGLSSYLRGVLCSASVLEAAGVGSAQATALSAAVTWALKDGVSMVGGLLFSYAASPWFDSYVKEFRLFADLVNDAGLALDMLAPYFSDNLLAVASLAGLCKALCGLSAGATKSSITCHFAAEGNMADLNAKEATQETLVSLVGMMVGVLLAHRLSELQDSGNRRLVIRVQWIVFLSLTALHVWANWRGVQLLRLRTLNRPRCDAVLLLTGQQSYSESIMAELLRRYTTMNDPNPREENVTDTSRIERALSALPKPSQVREPLAASAWGMLSNATYTAATLEAILLVDPEILSVFFQERYVLVLQPKHVRWMTPFKGHRRRDPYKQSSVALRALVTLLAGATADDQLKAYVHCLLLERVCGGHRDHPLHELNIPKRPLLCDGASSTAQERRLLVKQTMECLNLILPPTTAATSRSAAPLTTTTGPAILLSLTSALEAAGWEFRDRLYLGFPRSRSTWDWVSSGAPEGKKKD